MRRKSENEPAGADRAANPSDDGPIRVGGRLRHARLVKKLRLKDVANRSGYSESLISKFENNKATPSLNTLHRIARSLETSVAALLNENSGTFDVVLTRKQRPVLQELSIGGAFSDGTEAEVMIPLGASSLLQAFLIRVLPGGSSDGMRYHEGEEVGFVCKGELILTVSGVAYHLKEGDSFFYPSNREHSFSNPGPLPVEIIWVNTPPTL